ncbi:MAG: hypothetical protein CL467_05185 [Acidimicrobiaceae bacterium]|nr:hypothetical protein [Acidimicrobiaceae bacterium]
MFDPWWNHAINNYITWHDGRAVDMDLYYDPVVDQHVSSPMGLLAPIWYLAPQRPDMARSAWEMTVTLAGLDGNNPPTPEAPGMLADPGFASLLAMQTSEFDDGAIRDRVWAVLDGCHEPTVEADLGEHTYGFGLGEPHPRGQLNARVMAGWTCAPGAWSRIFNGPPDRRFGEPTVSGVDFPDVSLSTATWDGTTLHLAARDRDISLAGRQTTVQITSLPADGPWILGRPGITGEPVEVVGGSAMIELFTDGSHHELRLA